MTPRALFAPAYLLLCVLSCLWCAPEAHAQSLGLAPGEVRAAIKPGEPVRFELTVANDGDVAVVMRTTVMDLWYNEKNEKTFGVPGTHERSAANWIEFVPRDFAVPARGAAAVSVVVTPPAEIRGGYYAVLFVESTPALAQAGTAESRAIFTSLRLGALVLLHAAGTESVAIDVADVMFTPPGPAAPLTLAIPVTNRSNTHIFPQAKLTILGADRQIVARTETDARRFFPGQTDTLTLNWTGTLPPGSYVAILALPYAEGRVFTREFPFSVR